jgi:hypothetical protein
MLLVKSFIGLRESSPYRHLFRFFLLAYHVELTMIVRKFSGNSVETCLVEQFFELKSQEMRITRLCVFSPSVHDFLR